MSNPSKEAQKQQLKEQQEEAERRAMVIDAVVKEVLATCTKHGITINDLQVVINTIIKQAEQVFTSRKVSEFIEPDQPKEE